MQAPTVAETRQYLLPVIEMMLASPTRLTLEGFPLCVIAPHEDLAIEDGTREIRMMYQGEVVDDYDGFMDTQMRAYGPPCDGCPLRARCGGVYNEYAERRGWREFGLRQPSPIGG